jgi:hypothetical protein
MGFGDTVVSVMEQRAREIRLRTAMNSSAGSGSGSEKMRGDGDADGGPSRIANLRLRLEGTLRSKDPRHNSGILGCGKAHG